MAEHDTDTDFCAICGEPGADKIAMWVGGGVYWPGEQVPTGELVHQYCEQGETNRAFDALSAAERDDFLDSLIRRCG